MTETSACQSATASSPGSPDSQAPHRDPARVAVMLPRFSLYGGVEQFGYRLAAGLAERGHNVDFICARQETDAPHGVRVLSVGRPPGFKLIKMLWFLVGAERLRKSGRYDLAVSLGKTWQQDLSRMGGGPLTIFWDKSERALPAGLPRFRKRLLRRLSPSNWLTLFLEQRQFTTQSDVIAVSHLVRQWLLDAHNSLNPERVHVVYNRPDTARFHHPSAEEKATARDALAAASGLQPPVTGPDTVFIGTASTNFELKGIGPLVRAMALLPRNTVLFIAGGRDHGNYKKLAEAIGVEERVHFLGKVANMPGFYQALDIFILPTFYDACSNAVLEALASGCKCITTSSNGAAFFLDQEAVLDDPGNPQILADKLAHFMELPPPSPFAWPCDVPNGLDAFLDAVESRLEEQRRVPSFIHQSASQ